MSTYHFSNFARLWSNISIHIANGLWISVKRNASILEIEKAACLFNMKLLRDVHTYPYFVAAVGKIFNPNTNVDIICITELYLAYFITEF